MKEPSPHNLIVRYPWQSFAVFTGVMVICNLAYAWMGRFEFNTITVAACIAGAPVLSIVAIGILRAFMFRPWLVYVLIAMQMLGVSLHLTAIAMLVALPFVGWSVHLQYVINKRRREKTEKQ